jgi:predicted small metal-binding protein
MDRKYVDCRAMPSDSNCSLYISGTEEEVVRAAAEHAASVHGHEDTPELREEIRGSLRDEQVRVGTAAAARSATYRRY